MRQPPQHPRHDDDEQHHPESFVQNEEPVDGALLEVFVGSRVFESLGLSLT